MHMPTIDELKRALHIRENIENLQHELGSIFGRAGVRALGVMESGMKLVTKGIEGINLTRKKRTMSKSARAKIAEAQRARWAKVKKGKTAKAAVKTGKPAKKKRKGKMSAAGRANIIAAQKKRWAKVKREKKAGK